MNVAEHLEYDITSPTGLRWTVSRVGVTAGNVAGCTVTKKDGRRVCHVMFSRKLYFAHRIIWELHNGAIPDGMEIDHINGDSTDNRIENLRLATREVNTRNRKKFRNNTSGSAGVSSQERWGTINWRASWRDENGKLCSKSYSERKYGPAAKDMAIAKREEEIKKLGGYTERHGV